MPFLVGGHFAIQCRKGDNDSEMRELPGTASLKVWAQYHGLPPRVWEEMEAAGIDRVAELAKVSEHTIAELGRCID